MGSYIRSKWAKTEVLVRSAQMMPYIPETQEMKETTLAAMLDKYGMVYIKPNIGTYGRGVMRIEQQTQDNASVYRCYSGIHVKNYDTFQELYRSIVQRIKGRRYLVQRGIELARYRRKRFDIRVMVQRGPRGKWAATGMIARVAQLKKVVTNYHSGGTPMDVERVLSRYMTRTERERFVKRIGQVGVRAAKQLQKQYPQMDEIGVDIGVDRSFHPWIIEVNTKPDPYIFKLLRDKQVFRRVMRYVRAHRRTCSHQRADARKRHSGHINGGATYISSAVQTRHGHSAKRQII